MTEWKAEMPKERSYDDGRDGYGYACVAHACLADDVSTLVTRANEELDKVRAERDEARAEVQALGALGPQIHSIAAMHFEACSERDAALARVRELENTLEWTQKERDALRYAAPERGPWASTATQLVHESRMRQEAELRLAEAKAEAHQLGVNLHLERQKVRELTEWRPMETAPKDSWIHVAYAEPSIGRIETADVFHFGKNELAFVTGKSLQGLWILGWLPLPEAPKEAAQ